MANSHFSEKKWKYLSVALMGILATGFLFPQAFAAATTDSILAVVKDIQAKVNNATFGLQATSTKIDNLPGRILTFTNLQLNLGPPYIILPERSNLAYGIYVDITVSGLEGNEVLSIFCNTGSGGHGYGLQNGLNTLDLACTEPSFEGFNEGNPVTATVNGKIRYQNLFESNHEELWAGTPPP